MRTGLAELLGDRPAAVEPLLRFLVSQLLWASPREEASYLVGLLLGVEAPPVAVQAEAAQTVPGLGFPRRLCSWAASW